MASMKTTIDLPDALASDAKALARAEGSTLRDLVVSGLRHEIQRRTTVVPIDFAFPTFAGDGLVVDLAPEDAIARSYGMSE
ncbi:hypothetical protein GCM10009811_22700 [Nostocoides veronense]|uniref:Antitoxin n=2 Tax=Nostocoides veronense TaxID=330836 RepID=A0ABN2LS98_9MICO